MIDIQNEQLLTLSEAAAMLPGKPSIATLWRWRTKGARGRRLESIVLGGKVYTSTEAIGRFAHQEGGDVTAATRSPARRESEIRKAEKELEETGA